MMLPKSKYYNRSINIFKNINILLGLSVLFDVGYYLQGEDSILPIFRGILFYIYFIYIFIYYKIFSASNLTRITFLLIFYWLALVPFSSDMVVSVNFISKAIIPFLFLLIVSNLPPSFVYFKYIFKSFSFIIIVSIIFAFLSNVFGIGNASYAKGVEDFVRVGFGDAKLYAQAIAVVVFPFFWFSFKLTKKQKYIIIFLSIAAIIFSLISVRRTTLIILGLGSLLFFYFSGKIYSYMKIGVAILIPVILSLPLWLPIFEERMELRKSTFSAEYDIESEARYQEIFYVFNEGVVNSNITRFFLEKKYLIVKGNMVVEFMETGNYILTILIFYLVQV